MVLMMNDLKEVRALTLDKWTLTCTVSSAEAMMALGKRVATVLRDGDILLMHGPLGAGKTTFVQGLARGLGIADAVVSPTFALIQTYHGLMTLHHMDLYRLPPGEDLGFQEYIEDEALVVVEWPDAADDFWPDARMEIRIAYEDDGHEHGSPPRRITLTLIGRRYTERHAIVEDVLQEVCDAHSSS